MAPWVSPSSCVCRERAQRVREDEICQYITHFRVPKTKIGNNVFIGSGVELVAPITIEDGATVAAGSTLTKPVSKNKLAIERSKQQTIDGWKRPVKKKGK